MKTKCPEGLDLRQTLAQLTAQGYSYARTRRWRKEQGIVVPCGNPLSQKGLQPETLAAYENITEEDWAKGFSHVGRKVGVSRQRVQQIAVKMGRTTTTSHKRCFRRVV